MVEIKPKNDPIEVTLTHDGLSCETVEIQGEIDMLGSPFHYDIQVDEGEADTASTSFTLGLEGANIELPAEDIGFNTMFDATISAAEPQDTLQIHMDQHPAAADELQQECIPGSASYYGDLADNGYDNIHLHNGNSVMAADSLNGNQVDFHYFMRNGWGYALNSWRWTQAAEHSSTLKIAYAYTHHHGWHQDEAWLDLIVETESGTSTENLHYTTTTALIQDTLTLELDAGETWGFQIRGNHYDGTQRMYGTLSLTMLELTQTLETTAGILTTTGIADGPNTVTFYPSHPDSLLQEFSISATGAHHSSTISFQGTAEPHPDDWNVIHDGSGQSFPVPVEYHIETSYGSLAWSSSPYSTGSMDGSTPFHWSETISLDEGCYSLHIAGSSYLNDLTTLDANGSGTEFCIEEDSAGSDSVSTFIHPEFDPIAASYYSSYPYYPPTENDCQDPLLNSYGQEYGFWVVPVTMIEDDTLNFTLQGLDFADEYANDAITILQDAQALSPLGALGTPASLTSLAEIPGGFTYEAAEEFPLLSDVGSADTDSLVFSMIDGDGHEVQVSMVVRVVPRDDGPASIIEGGAFTWYEDATLNFTTIITDPDGIETDKFIHGDVASGTLNLVATNLLDAKTLATDWTYLPDPDVHGTD
ncbi:MAG: hypothetical protein L7U25_01545, partial [Candidatus Poseidonia sp.]|nr:hypothetical protein [Poseidonia sp.]